jgi:hypothetical protein
MEAKSKSKRKKHPEAFKREAVRLLEGRGERTVADVAAGFGVRRDDDTLRGGSVVCLTLETLGRPYRRPRVGRPIKRFLTWQSAVAVPFDLRRRSAKCVLVRSLRRKWNILPVNVRY